MDQDRFKTHVHAENVLMLWLALSSHIYFFAFRDTYRGTLVSLCPETRDVARRVSGRK